MRVLVMVLAMILLTAPNVFAQGSAACPTQPVMTSSCDMVDTCIMQCFQVSKQQLTMLRDQGWSDADIAMAAAISTKAKVSISQVAADYKANPNWQAVASKYNLSMSDLMTSPMATSADEETFNRMFTSRYYNVSTSDIAQLRQQGYSWATINMMANAASQTRQPIMTIAGLRAQGMEWCDIAARYNVACSNLTGPTSTAVMVTPRTAVVGAGPMMMPRYIYDYNGGILMTESEAMRFYNMGYDWTDVAIAANIAAQTGVPVSQVLSRMRTGTTAWDMVNEGALDPCSVFDISNYPFEQRSIYSQGMQEKNMKRIECYRRSCGGECPAAVPAPCPAPCPPASQ